MPCDTRLRENQTLAERGQEIDAALTGLERLLQSGAVKVTIAPNGAIAFAGWKDRTDVSDVCAYRLLSVKSSFALRQAVARAESMQGRKVNPSAIAAGWHTHNGQNWSKH